MSIVSMEAQLGLRYNWTSPVAEIVFQTSEISAAKLKFYPYKRSTTRLARLRELRYTKRNRRVLVRPSPHVFHDLLI